MSQSTTPTTYRCILMALSFVSRGWACTIAVGLDPARGFTVFQAAIDAARTGDTIVFADGTYTAPGNRDVGFRGKAITVRSGNGPTNCRIDCRAQGRGFLSHRGETRSSILEGFTIANGQTGRGGGICCVEASSPTINNCVFEGNLAIQGGGAVYVSRSNPVLPECLLRRDGADYPDTLFTRCRGGVTDDRR